MILVIREVLAHYLWHLRSIRLTSFFRKFQFFLIRVFGFSSLQSLEQLLHLPEYLRIHPRPVGYYKKFNDWLNIVDGHCIEVERLGYRLADAFKRKLPVSLSQTIHSEFLNEETRDGEPIFAYKIANARVWGEQGTVITNNNHIIVEISPEFRSTPEEFNIFQQPYLGSIRYLKGTTILLGAPAGYVYGHWMMDVLPRLGVLEQLGIQWRDSDYFFVNGTHIPFQKSSLELLGIPSEKWVSGCQTPYVRCERLITPSLPGFSGNMPRWAVEWLRKQFLPHAKDPGTGSRIYIVRKSGGRNILNEAELIRELDKQGFKPVVLEKLSFEEQIGVFANAEIVVGGNGSGMFNLIFCSPYTKVIELFSDASVNVCQWAAGQHIPVTYGYVIGEASKQDGTHPHSWNYFIEVSDIIALLNKLNIKLTRNCSNRSEI